MAKPTTFKGSLVALYIEDTGNPGTYIKPCGLTNHNVNFSKNANEVDVPDCDDPELPSWLERDVSSFDLGGSGEGRLAAEAVDAWWAAFNTTDSINARIYIGTPTDTVNGRYWAGKIHVTNFDTVGNRGDKADCTVSFASDGEITFNVTT